MIAAWDHAIYEMCGGERLFDLPPNRNCNGLGPLQLHGTTVDIVESTPNKTTFKYKGANGKVKEGKAKGFYRSFAYLRDHRVQACRQGEEPRAEQQ